MRNEIYLLNLAKLHFIRANIMEIYTRINKITALRNVFYNMIYRDNQGGYIYRFLE